MEDAGRDVPAILAALEAEGLDPGDPRRVVPTLEDVFIAMIERAGGAGGAPT